MKICIIELVSRGGMVHYASQLCNHLSRNADVNTVYIIAPDNINELLFDNHIILKKIPSIGRHGYRIDLILKYLHEIKPDIIHITVIHPFVLPILPFLKKKHYLVSTIHDVILHPGQSNLFLNMTTDFISKYSDLTFVHGEKLKLQLMKKGILGSKIAVIPIGDFSFFDRMNQDEILEEKNTILFFGRIQKYKGIEYLLKAEPFIASKLSNFKIVIAGNGDFSEYQKLISDMSHFEIINDYIPDEMVSKLFQKASVVVLPYIEGSQSGVIPIAYSFKKPVVVTDVGCIPEVVIDGVTGIIIKPKDSESLAESILRILSDEESKKKMGENAYDFMRNHMSWEEIAKKTVWEYSTHMSKI